MAETRDIRLIELHLRLALAERKLYTWLAAQIAPTFNPRKDEAILRATGWLPNG